MSYPDLRGDLQTSGVAGLGNMRHNYGDCPKYLTATGRTRWYENQAHELRMTLRAIDRSLAPTDALKNSAADERNRIATARVLIANALQAAP